MDLFVSCFSNSLGRGYTCRYCKILVGSWGHHLNAPGLPINATPEELERVDIAQHGLCATCLHPETAKMNGKVIRLSADHDHKTGDFRGFLCDGCNKTVGSYTPEELLIKATSEKDPKRQRLLERAADYVKNHLAFRERLIEEIAAIKRIEDVEGPHNPVESHRAQLQPLGAP